MPDPSDQSADVPSEDRQLSIPDEMIRSAQLDEGIALYGEGRMKDAAASLQRAVDLAPTSHKAWLMLGLARFDSGNNSGAEDAARKALQYDPRSPEAVMLLASIYLAAGGRGAADEMFRRYLELAPEGEAAADARRLMSSPK